MEKQNNNILNKIITGAAIVGAVGAGAVIVNKVSHDEESQKKIKAGLTKLNDVKNEALDKLVNEFTEIKTKIEEWVKANKDENRNAELKKNIKEITLEIKGIKNKTEEEAIEHINKLKNEIIMLKNDYTKALEGN